jgi:hypothetical protein
MISKTLYEQLKTQPFSYGEFLSTILEHQGKPISTLPNEDFLFPDNSILRLTNNNIQLLEFLQE